MGEEGLRYDAMVEDALRSVVRRALSYAAERGLPGDHHFYISFLTGHPGVDIPEHLSTRYPNEMTIVLQYQFWGLDVGEEVFGVTLSFSDVPERLTVPFAAVTAFADPSVRFGLQFESGAGQEGGVLAPAPATEQKQEPAGATERPSVPPSKPPASKPAAEPGTATETNVVGAEAPPGAKVVTLDSFRKKQP